MNRRKDSGGQAIILVTLALLAMCGMMGLAVDMGWSFFVHKEAQTAADAAALAAVEAAYQRLTSGPGVITEFTCAAGGGTGSNQLDCETNAVGCGSVVATSNLNNGCQYAKKNGFDWTAARQGVTLQSYDSTTLPTTSPGVVNMVYWVTARTVQTVPQLFSAVNSTTEGTVSAVATAAIAASIGPGQFYGMNHLGDCLGLTGTPGGVLSKGSNCGVDVTLSPGGGNQTICGNGKANLCAPAGIILASQCNSKSNGVCDNGVAGDGGNNGVAMGSTLTIKGNNTAATDGTVTGTWQNMATPPKALTPVYSMSSTTFQDPTAANSTSQPPLVSELGNNGTYPAIGSCGYPGGVIPAGVTLGPYQYYSYQTVGGVKVPDGKQITFAGDVTFSNSGGTQCPDPLNTGNIITTAGASQGSSKFPTYIFYGGVNASGSNMTMGPGQYVMAGTNTQANIDGNNKNVDVVFQAPTNNTITGDTTTGTMWVFTDANYPGMATQLANVPGNTTAIQNLTQGSMYFQNSQISLSGLIGSANQGSNLPKGLDAYSGIVWWQDRRNSDVGYNQAPNSTACVAAGVTCTGDDGTVLVCATNSDCVTGTAPNTVDGNSDSNLAKMLAANHVTATSPGLVMDPGNANIALRGVFYQPRGAWMSFVAGNSGFTCTPGQGGGPNSQCPLQVITGALLLDHGTVSLNLAGPTNPIIQYKPVLIH